MPKLIKKISLSFLSFLLFFVSVAPNLSYVYADSTLQCGAQNGHCTLTGNCANGNPISSSDCTFVGFKCCPNAATAGTSGTTSTGTNNTNNTNSNASTPTNTNTAATAPAPTGTWYNQDFKDWFSKVYDPNVSPSNEIFGERYTAAQVQWVVYGLWAFIINIVLPQDLTACMLTNSTNLQTCGDLLNSKLKQTSGIVNPADQSQKQQSLLSLVFATDRPFSGIAYVRNTIQNFSLVPVAHAQTAGFGYNALNFIQPMWAASRNIAFALFVLAAVIFAFMIMFRVKISPQVVISVQSAIPKLIIALILVTFSYAIAGFLIDIMYVIYGIISLVGRSFFIGLSVSPTSLFQFLTAGRLGIGNFGVDTGIFGLIAIYLIFFALTLSIAVFYTFGVLPGLLAGVATAAFISLAAPLFVILGIIILILAIIVLIWHCIKILWTLLKAYVNILLLTIFAPLQIIAGLIIPGLSFGTWIKSFASNLAVFITVSSLTFFSFVFLYFGLYIVSIDIFGGAGIDGVIQGFAKILLGTLTTSAISQLGKPSPWPPLLGSTGGAGASGVGALLMVGVSFVMFTLIPKAAEIVQGFISGKPFAYGSAISEAIVSPIGALMQIGAAGAKYGPEISKVYKSLKPIPEKPPEPPGNQFGDYDSD